jgi:hypothetical protein
MDFEGKRTTMGGVALTRQMMIVDEGFCSLFNDCHFKSTAVPGKRGKYWCGGQRCGVDVTGRRLMNLIDMMGKSGLFQATRKSPSVSFGYR